MSKVEEKVIDKIRQRAEVGFKKYGTTMERDDYSLIKWLKEFQSECLDSAIYAEKIIELLNLIFKKEPEE
jgi:hypothetical protein